jgi:cytochrome c oxidase subunit 2
MRGRVIIQEPNEFENWLTAEQGQNSPASHGRVLLDTLQCRTCHRTSSAESAPPLEGLFGGEVLLSDGSAIVAEENYIRESILDPGKKIVRHFQNVMPSYRGKISEEEIMHVIAYLKSVRAKP